jgi:hypothetical protein
VQPENREALEKFFGSYGAEAMVLASDPENVLWTDDLIQTQTSAQEFGSRRVWTQIVLGALADLGLLSAEEYGDATARLLGMEFVATQFDSSSLISAFNLASWSASKWPAAQVLRTFSNPATDLMSLFKIFIEFTIRLYRESRGGSKTYYHLRSLSYFLTTGNTVFSFIFFFLQYSDSN